MTALTLDFTRHLRAGAGATRTELQRALEELGFKIGTNLLTMLEAKRGSKLGAAAT